MQAVTAFARYIGTKRWLMRIEPLIPYLERFLGWLTGGRVSVLRLAGLPGLRLTVAGRKSGEPRTNNLLCAPYRDGFVVNGSNWGKPKHPTWTVNLMAAETAEVTSGATHSRYGCTRPAARNVHSYGRFCWRSGPDTGWSMSSPAGTHGSFGSSRSRPNRATSSR